MPVNAAASGHCTNAAKHTNRLLKKTHRSILPALIAFATISVSSMAQMPALKTVPMLDCTGLPCVDITTASGKHLKMMVDTGNASSILDSAKAKELGLEVQPYVGSDGKPTPDYLVTKMEGASLGETKLGDFKLLVVALQPDIQKGSLPAADGLLSYRVFKDRILKLDYNAHQVSLSDVLTTDVPCPGFCGTITHPTFGKQGPPIVVATGFQVNGQPIDVQIDTLYTGTMLIYPTSVEKLGLTAQQSSPKTRFFPHTDGGVDMIEGTAQKESFGTTALKTDATLYFATPKVHTPDGMFDGTVGHELFTGHVVTLDFHTHHFWMI
jgi:Aspartyl protease